MPSHRAAAVASAAVLLFLSGCGSEEEDPADASGGTWTATLDLTPGWSAADPRATGSVDITSTGETSVRVTATGLRPSTEYMAHVHDGECDENPPGGGHWLADPGGEDAAGNIIELSFTTSESGVGSATVGSDLVLDDRAESFVVHAPDALTAAEGIADNRVLCGDLDDD
ncbi:superoxide dismutase family protein [Glycomyces albidus]|jgi:hypothetical protein|uniref:Uncharacterized protein n=1 Tax=Glycomyces albidus TaxID=2656774 RepID=A0A6L5G3R3_9ACTN|nr:superoxide dismutase family protein [Glycomyces albidus]MQM24331.1 hypothetical protein [Glycomyces albidus]